MWLKIVLLILVYVVIIRTSDPEECPASRDTVLHVPSCPRNREEWKRRSDAKNCSHVVQSCTDSNKFVYHCVINSYENETLEVCAPTKAIMGYSCVEFNNLGGRIQESSVKCNHSSCPFRYVSTDVYKYQECFQAVESNTNLPEYMPMCSNRSSCDNSRERNWQIATVVMIIINVTLFVETLWMVISKRKIQKREKSDKADGTKETKIATRKSDKAKQSRNTDTDVDEETALFDKGGNQGSDKDKFYVAAIDIGDRCYNMALCCSDSPTVVKTLGKWDRICLLLDEKGGFKAFGKDAIESYKKEENDKCKLFYDFKLSQVPKEENGNVYIEMVSQLLNRMSNELNRLDVKVQHFVFIVPTYWVDGSIKELRKRSSSKVMEILKIGNGMFSVIRREKSISPIIHEVNTRALCLNFNVENLALESEGGKTYDDYAILHIGSRYCDLTFWSKGEDRNNKYERYEWKIPPPEYMLKILGEEIYGIPKLGLKSWKEACKRDYNSFLSLFEDLQNEMNAHTDDEEYVFKANIPDSLRKFAPGITNQSIESSISKIDGITFMDSDCEFGIKHKFFEKCFWSIKEKVLKKIKRADKDLRNVKCVVMTGSYSHMELVRRAAEEEWFKGMQITVVIPENTQVFAMGGAYYVYSEVKN